jgi:tight adherence protein B
MPAGADVVAALMRLADDDATRPGSWWLAPGCARTANRFDIRHGLVAVERLALSAGASRADLLGTLSACLTDGQELADAREAALAGPRATARVLAWLPALGLLLGTAIGAEPLRAIAGGGLATTAAMVGVGLMTVGWVWTRVMLARATPADDGPLFTLNLLAAALEAGLAMPTALAAAGEFGRGTLPRSLVHVGQRLSSGHAWDRAWADSGCSPHCASPAAVLQRIWLVRRRRPDDEVLAACRRTLNLAWQRGVAAAPLLRALAERWRGQARRQAAVAAARLGVQLMLPLGLCYLPAFVALGLVPVIVSLAGDLFLAW